MRASRIRKPNHSCRPAGPLCSTRFTHFQLKDLIVDSLSTAKISRASSWTPWTSVSTISLPRRPSVFGRFVKQFHWSTSSSPEDRNRGYELGFDSSWNPLLKSPCSTRSNYPVLTGTFDRTFRRSCLRLQTKERLRSPRPAAVRRGPGNSDQEVAWTNYFRIYPGQVYRIAERPVSIR